MHDSVHPHSNSLPEQLVSISIHFYRNRRQTHRSRQTSTSTTKPVLSLGLLLSVRPTAGSSTSFWQSTRSSLYTAVVFTSTTRSYSTKKPKKMPPKKAVKEEKLLLGRPGNNLKSGIVRELQW